MGQVELPETIQETCMSQERAIKIGVKVEVWERQNGGKNSWFLAT